MPRPNWRHLAGGLLGLTLSVVAVVVLCRNPDFRYEKIKETLNNLSGHWQELTIAVGLTAAAYLTLTGYDLLALRWIRRPVPTGKVAFTSFLSYVFSNNIGMSVLGASAMRLRLYTHWGLSVMEVVKIVAFASFTFWLGLLFAGGLTSVVSPMRLPENYQFWGMTTARPIGFVLAGLVLAYIAFCWLRKAPINIFRKRLVVPSGRISVLQILVGTVDWVLAALVFYVLLWAVAPRAPMGPVMSGFMLALILSQAAHSPGGIGTLELLTVTLLVHGHQVEIKENRLLAIVLAWRLIYLILPLLVGTIMLVSYEIIQHKRRLVPRGGLKDLPPPMPPDKASGRSHSEPLSPPFP